MAKEIKQKIVLEGERDYNNAIKEAQRNLKTLRSELKAETAELGKNATEQQKAATKAKSLREQIKEQESIVKTLREALDEVKEKYADNADEVAKWEQRLNNARTTLANMRSDLEGVSSGMRGISTDAAAATVATQSVADAFESISSVGESVSGAIEGIFGKIVDTITGAVGQLWDLISETAAKANNWTDIAHYWGTDAKTIQGYAMAVQASAGSFEDLNGIVSKIVMGGKGKKITELLGISDVGYKTDWEYAMAVMNKMQKMADEGKDMTPIYEEIFGEKKSQKVMWMVNNWAHIQEMLPDFEDDRFGMSEDELDTMNQLWIKIQEIETKWEALKSKIAAGFGKVALDLLVNVEGTLEGFADYLNADSEEERQAALDKIKTNIEEFFKKLAAIVTDALKILNEVGTELQNSDDPITRAIGDILVGLTNALQWMIDNQEAVKAAFEAIFGIWLLGKLAAVAASLAGILANIKIIQGFGMANAATNVVTGATAAGSGATAAGAGGGLFAGLNLTALGNVMAGLTPLGVLALGTIPAYLADKADRRARHEALGQMQAQAEAAAAEMGEQGDAALAAVRAATMAMDYNGEKNFAGLEMMGLQPDIQAALDEVADMNDEAEDPFLSNRTALMMKYGRGGMTDMQEYELLDKAAKEATAYLEAGNAHARVYQDPEEALSDALDAITELKEGEFDPTGENMYRLLDSIIDNPAITGKMSEGMLTRIADYMNPEVGFGIGSPTQFTDAQQLMDELFDEMDGLYWDLMRERDPNAGATRNEAAGDREGEADGLERRPGRTTEPVPVVVADDLTEDEKPGETALERNDLGTLSPPGEEAVGIPGELADKRPDDGRHPVPRREFIYTRPRPWDTNQPGLTNDDWEYLSPRTALLARYNTYAGMTDMDQYELMATAVQELKAWTAEEMETTVDATEALSDALDAITELREDEEIDPTGERMYRLLDSIIDNPVITGQLSEDMLFRLGEYLYPSSGFGVGSPTRYSDAQQLLDELYAEMETAYWSSLEAGKEDGGEILNKLDELIDAETDTKDKWTDPEGYNLRTLDADRWKNAGGSGADGLSGMDLRNFFGLPAQISAAVKSGAAAGVGGIRVTLDGYSVGRLVAPYVSQEIARDLP